MKLKKLAWLLVCMPVSLFAQTLQSVTDAGNNTTNHIFITGGQKYPTTGKGLLLATDAGGSGSYIFVKDVASDARMPLHFEASDIRLNPTGNLRIVSTTSVATRGALFYNDESSAGRSALVLDANGGDALGLDYFQLTHLSDARGVMLETTNAAPMFLMTNQQKRMTITADGKIGINTDNPTSALDVNGELHSVGAIFTSNALVSIYGDANTGGVGGHINLMNPMKTGSGLAKEWKIFNMTGPYGNGLQFWAYDAAGCGGPLCKPLMVIGDNGNVGVGTNNPTARLAVNGDIKAHKIKVTTNAADWADYVFADNYQLPSLHSVEAYIREHKHLPEIPSAATIEEKGQDLGEIQKLQMQKIEELTLYIIQQNKRIEALESQLKEIKKDR